MKLLRPGIFACLLLCTVIFCFGCQDQPTPSGPTPYRPPERPTPTMPAEDPLKDAYKKDPAAYVVFSKATEPQYKYVSVQDLMAYESMYSDCNGTWFGDQLSGEDLCIYKGYLYAMEHCYIGFELYVEDNDRDFQYIREAVSLDSPLLEQNINQYGENTWSQANNYIGERIFFRVEQFAQTRWQKRQEAMEMCKQIVSSMPAFETQLEKAQYLYRYVCDHVEYAEYENMADENYFYDAVCKGKSVCDGYSNMLNMLFNLAGIQSCEAMGYNIQDFDTATEEELENAGGHTWVVAKLDDVFYNFDPTWEDTKDASWDDDFVYFGFSDALAPVKYLSCEELRPKCTDTSRDFLYADLVVANITDRKNIKKIGEITEKRASQGQYVTLIAVNTPVSEKDISKFYGQYGSYVKKIRSVEAEGQLLRGSTLLWLTVTV